MNLEDVLRGAEVLSRDYEGYDVRAAEIRLVQRIADRTRPDRGRWLMHTAPPTPWGVDTQAVENRASDDLRAMSLLILGDSRSRARLRRFAVGPHHDPVGARVFACLLHLIDRPEPARFWWRYAAGADDPTAAYCLYLDHLGTADYLGAGHWLGAVWLSGFLPDREWGSRLAAPPENSAIDPRVTVHITEIQDEDLGDINLPERGLPHEVANCG